MADYFYSLHWILGCEFGPYYWALQRDLADEENQ